MLPCQNTYVSLSCDQYTIKAIEKERGQNTSKTFLPQLLRAAFAVATNMACSLIQQVASKQSAWMPQQHVAHEGTLYFTGGRFCECSGLCLLTHSYTQNNPMFKLYCSKLNAATLASTLEEPQQAAIIASDAGKDSKMHFSLFI